MREIKVGAIGTGGIFTFGHIPAYAKIPEIRLVALADPSKHSLKRALKQIKDVFSKEIERLKSEGLDDLAERLNEIMSSIKTYRDYREMLEKEDLDLVDICTPHKFHKVVAIDALKSGVHVMVEKPMTRTYIEAMEVVEVVKETGKLFQVNLNYIFARGFYEVFKLIQSGVIGEPTYVIVPCSHSGPEWKGWFWSPDLGGGGSLIDLGCHAICVAWYLFGFDKKPVIVKAEKFTGITVKARDRYIEMTHRRICVEDDAHVLIRFEDEKDGSWFTSLIEGSWSGLEYDCTTIFGTKGIIRVFGKGERAVIEIIDYLGTKRSIEVHQPFTDSITFEIANMCRCILEGRKSILNEEVGAEIMAIIDAAYYSEMMGRKAIPLDDFKKFAHELIEKYGDKASDKFIEMKTNYFSKL